MVPIHRAANLGEIGTLCRLLAEGVSVDTRSASGFTPLHRVCFAPTTTDDREACFKLLRDAGANLEATAAGGYAPLHYAAEDRNKPGLVSIVSLMIEAGVNVNVANSYGTTPLHNAAKLGSEATVAMLVKAGAAVNVSNDLGKRPLHYARDHNPRVCHILLRAGASLVPSDYMSNPPKFAVPVLVTSQYLQRVTDAGGFKKYEQAHIARITKILAPTPRLPPEMVRKIVEFWLHAGYY